MKYLDNLDVSLTLTYGKILVEPEPREEVLPSGIIIPGSSDYLQCNIGTVVKHGWKRFLLNGEIEEFVLNIGDKIFFNRKSASDILFKGKEYYIIDETSVIGVIE